jgi:DNA-binding response OmpR family regulator
MGISPAPIKRIDYPAPTVRRLPRGPWLPQSVRSGLGPMRLLIIDADQKAARALAKRLRDERFVVDTAYASTVGDAMASVNTYDVIVLDWILPDKNGIAVCRDLRARGISTPILLLTARASLEDRVTGLKAADDFLTKPFDFDELLARIHALLRRSDLRRPMLLRVADLTLDPVSHRVIRGGRTIHLTRKEYAILAVLMRHAGEVVSRSRLTQSGWESNADSLLRGLDVHVHNLRKKIDVAGRVPLIRTIRGSGYVVGPPEA